MVLNAYTFLTLAAAALEAGLAVAVLVVAARVARRRRADPLGADAAMPLAGHVATTLLVVAVGSWPLLYLLLDSYVPLWRGVVCIQGVTQVGEGSVGPARWLPPLVTALQATKPAVVLAVAAWATVHAANRATATAALLGRELAVLATAGAVALLDAAATAAYVGIPKREVFLESACCAVVPRAGRLGDPGFVTLTRADHDAAVLVVAWGALVLALTLAVVRAVRRPGWTAAALGAAAASVPLGLTVLREVAAPRLLGVADHRCVYCVLAGSVAGVAALALHAVGVGAVALAAVARALGRAPGDPRCRERQAAGFLRVARWVIPLATALVGVQGWVL